MGLYPTEMGPTDKVKLPPKNGDFMRASHNSPKVEIPVIRDWVKKGGTREDYLHIAALDGDVINGISLKDISIYESMQKKSSNGLVSDLNTKLLLERKKAIEDSCLTPQITKKEGDSTQKIQIPPLSGETINFQI